MSSSPTFRTPQDAASAGYKTLDYAGSLDEWIDVAARTMTDRYLRGDQSMLDNLSGATGPIGQPNRADFGSAKDGKTGQASDQTYRFFYEYVKAYPNDPWIREQFGPPPTRSATYTPAGLTREDILKENQLNRENDLAVAREYAGATIRSAEIQAGAQIASTAIRAQTDWAIAQLESLTRQYIAEGEWALQREIAYMQENGTMTRFLMELGFREKELAVKAVDDRNRHHQAMMGLIAEIAKYDAELASKPRNWVAYAAWLQNRGEVVNGLTLATAAQAVPESMIAPQELVNTPAGQSLAGGIVVQNILIAGQNGMQVNGVQIGWSPQQPQQGQGYPWGGQQGQGYPWGWQQGQGQPWSGQFWSLPGGGAAGQAGGQGGWQLPYPQYSYGGINLSSTDYTQIANQILGLSGNQPFTQEQLQTAYESVNPAGGQVSTEGYYAGPKTNRLGMTVNPLGHKNRFKDFLNLLPSQQEMNIGAVSSVGRHEEDYLSEFTRSMPKGKARGAIQYG